jgi:Fe-S oxidoreductase
MRSIKGLRPDPRLLPAARQAPENAVIVADGISCRQQIRHAVGRDPKHLVEVVAEKLGV